MSGHSKWANIKIKKGKTDAQRGSIFTKIGREIAVAVKAGGPDPNSNSKLRDVIAKAKQNNMPNDTINRSIKKASGEQGGVNYEAITYEGYGAGGVAVIVETLTDNRNRTAGDVRHLFDKYGGSMGQTGCVSYMFNKKGVIIADKTMDEDELMMVALDAGAEDIVPDDDVYEIYTTPSDVYAVSDKLKEAGVNVLSADTDMIADNEIDTAGHLQSVQKLIDMLEELDDVQNVYHNALLPEEEEEE